MNKNLFSYMYAHGDGDDGADVDGVPVPVIRRHQFSFLPACLPACTCALPHAPPTLRAPTLPTCRAPTTTTAHHELQIIAA